MCIVTYIVREINPNLENRQKENMESDIEYLTASLSEPPAAKETVSEGGLGACDESAVFIVFISKIAGFLLIATLIM